MITILELLLEPVYLQLQIIFYFLSLLIPSFLCFMLFSRILSDESFHFLKWFLDFLNFIGVSQASASGSPRSSFDHIVDSGKCILSWYFEISEILMRILMRFFQISQSYIACHLLLWNWLKSLIKVSIVLKFSEINEKLMVRSPSVFSY